MIAAKASRLSVLVKATMPSTRSFGSVALSVTTRISSGSAAAGMSSLSARLRKSGASTVVLGDLGCMLNIEGRLRKEGDTQTRVLHIAELLDELLKQNAL